MTDCSFCDKEFDSKRELHLHWGDRHEDELNSHQKDKLKKARRKHTEEKDRKRQKRKKQALYGLSAVLGLVVIGLIGPQLIPSGNPSAGELNLEDELMLGNPNASVTVVEFGDYRCPYCKQFEEEVFPKLKSQYIDTGKIKFHFVNFAFLGQGSQKAAVAAECVYDQNKTQYWDYHNAIYENQGPESEEWVTTDLLINLAREHTEGLDYGKLRSCIESRGTAKEVFSDTSMGRKNGIGSTPSVLVNGELVQGNSFEAVKNAIERELN